MAVSASWTPHSAGIKNQVIRASVPARSLDYVSPAGECTRRLRGRLALDLPISVEDFFAEEPYRRLMDSAALLLHVLTMEKHGAETEAIQIGSIVRLIQCQGPAAVIVAEERNFTIRLRDMHNELKHLLGLAPHRCVKRATAAG